ncbi:hypothetical protein GVO57_13555 [Sphingomonas changnyeongensis]|uniref:Uncharacterized protein n=1 Tax=Sphingomonas changnyeongensis TaxID=2698679 RepID=A0A7Z2NYB3_9SPHN|nr:hypothetical protein [Sphingomonas changnyeongensis]QHL91637.1 hypothetical protein GVO57_13555 [Sphingomonas changnyeongensis]
MDSEELGRLVASATALIHAQQRIKSVPRDVANKFVSPIFDVCPTIKLPALLALDETQQVMAAASITKSMLADELKRARKARKEQISKEQVVVPKRTRKRPKSQAVYTAPSSPGPYRPAGQLPMPGLVPNGPISDL